MITIDSPGFAHKVADKIRPFCLDNNIKHIHYVAPSVWAWKPKRIHRCKKHFDALLAIVCRLSQSILKLLIYPVIILGIQLWKVLQARGVLCHFVLVIKFRHVQIL